MWSQVWEALLWNTGCPWVYPKQVACELALKIPFMVWKGHTYSLHCSFIWPYYVCSWITSNASILHSGDWLAFEMGEWAGAADIVRAWPVSPSHTLPHSVHSGRLLPTSHLLCLPTGFTGALTALPAVRQGTCWGN